MGPGQWRSGIVRRHEPIHERDDDGLEQAHLEEHERRDEREIAEHVGADITEVLDWAAASRNRLQALEDDPSRAEALEEPI